MNWRRSQEILDQTDALLSEPGRISRLNATLLREGWLDPTRPSHPSARLGQNMGRFMTMLLMVIDPNRSEMRWVRPVMTCPSFRRSGGRFVEVARGGVQWGPGAARYAEFVLADLVPVTIFLPGTDGSWVTKVPSPSPYQTAGPRTYPCTYPCLPGFLSATKIRARSGFRG